MEETIAEAVKDNIETDNDNLKPENDDKSDNIKTVDDNTKIVNDNNKETVNDNLESNSDNMQDRKDKPCSSGDCDNSVNDTLDNKSVIDDNLILISVEDNLTGYSVNHPRSR